MKYVIRINQRDRRSDVKVRQAAAAAAEAGLFPLDVPQTVWIECTNYTYLSIHLC